jgi:hypothetical protein
VKLLVYLRDGRTCYVIEGRGKLAELVNQEPWHEGKSLKVVRGIWNPAKGEYAWNVVFLRSIAKGSIGVVEEARGIVDAVEQ